MVLKGSDNKIDRRIELFIKIIDFIIDVRIIQDGGKIQGQTTPTYRNDVVSALLKIKFSSAWNYSSEKLETWKLGKRPSIRFRDNVTEFFKKIPSLREKLSSEKKDSKIFFYSTISTHLTKIDELPEIENLFNEWKILTGVQYENSENEQKTQASSILNIVFSNGEVVKQFKSARKQSEFRELFENFLVKNNFEKYVEKYDLEKWLSTLSFEQAVRCRTRILYPELGDII